MPSGLAIRRDALPAFRLTAFFRKNGDFQLLL
jgi:hypothetical protein